MDEKSAIIPANEAVRCRDYYCIECQGVVHARGGEHRRDHFYHLKTPLSCKSHEKSLEHINIQYFLLNSIPSGECFLEHRFKEINRIADVCWRSQKIIFEIQCSFISAKEIEARNADYKKMGFEVIWILHDRLYNRRRLTAAEKYLMDHPHYYSNIDKDGVGNLYDHFKIVEKGCRKNYYGPFVLTRQIKVRRKNNLEASFACIDHRFKRWKVHLDGDLMTHYLENSDIPFLNTFREEKNIEKKKTWKEVADEYVIQPLHSFLNHLLEKSMMK